MKKKSIKLSLRKVSVSSFKTTRIMGGSDNLCSQHGLQCKTHKTIGPVGSVGPACNPDSHAGCTGTPDETITCPLWSCACDIL